MHKDQSFQRKSQNSRTNVTHTQFIIPAGRLKWNCSYTETSYHITICYILLNFMYITHNL